MTIVTGGQNRSQVFSLHFPQSTCVYTTPLSVSSFPASLDPRRRRSATTGNQEEGFELLVAIPKGGVNYMSGGRGMTLTTTTTTSSSPPSGVFLLSYLPLLVAAAAFSPPLSTSPYPSSSPADPAPGASPEALAGGPTQNVLQPQTALWKADQCSAWHFLNHWFFAALIR